MNKNQTEDRKSTVEKRDLEVMSIDKLHEYIEDLEQEITRAKLAVDLKGDAKSAAESFFKS